MSCFHLPRLRRRRLAALVGACALALWSVSFSVPLASAEELEVNATLSAFELEDQHGEPRRVDARTRAILFSRDMEGGKLLKAGLSKRLEGDLASRRVVYVADISGMPRLVARLFALPSMRRRPYPMLLDRDGAVTAVLPDEPGRATVIHLDSLRVMAIERLDTAAAVTAAVDAMPIQSDTADTPGDAAVTEGDLD